MRSLSTLERIGILRSFFVAGRFLRQSPHWSRDEMLAWQWQKITRLVQHAYDKVPFYHDLYAAAGFAPGDLRAWEDFHRLPTVSKAQVVANYPGRIVAKGHDIKTSVISRSSGSSGTPMDIAYDAEAMSIYALAGLRLYGMGFRYLPWHRQLYIYTSPYPLNSMFGLYPMTFVPTLAAVPDIIAAMRKVRPDLLVCYPSHLRQIADEMTDADFTAIRLLAISVNSEMSTQTERDYLADKFGCPVLDEYSSEELTRIAAQCRCGTYHVFEDINYMEDTSDPLRHDAAGSLVGTNLHNFAMPMIRYEQNDFGEIREATCDCGWNFRALTRLEGRRNDSFLLPSGRTLSSGFLLDATYEILLTYRREVKDFCLIQTAPDKVTLEIVAGGGWDATLGERISARLNSLLGPGVEVKVEVVFACTKTKSGKRNPIISRVPRSRP